MALNNQEDTFSSVRQQQQQVKTPYIISKFSNMELNENETLFRQVRILVNKLTPQNMENITNQLISLPILTEDQLIGSIEIIFKNAIDEQSFSQIYAQLCKALSSIKVPSKNDSFRTVNFRTMLLTRCQKEFNTDYYQAINYDQLMKEVEQCKFDTKKRELVELANEKLTKAKRRSLGNIRFIGELFKLSMLTESTMNDCIERLLKQENDEENLECLCRLLTTIGKEVDKPNNATKMKIYFDHLERLVRKKESASGGGGGGGGLILKSRIRFMILDVLDLRKNQWIPRRKVNNPRPLEEIRKEAEQEALVSAAKNQQDFYDHDSADNNNKLHSVQFKHQQQKSSINMIKKITDMVNFYI
jgi:translation initiation factor 4G